MGWIISPSEGVENYDNGSFTLPCSESNVTYKITYVNSEGCSSNTVSYTYVTSGSCDSPTPDCPTQSSIINTNTAVANTGGTQVAVMQILKDSTYTAYTITATSTSSSYVSNITQGAHLHNNWYVVLADVTANPGTSDRSLYFDVVVKGPTLGTGCTYNNVTVTQNGGCPTVDYYGSTIPAEGSPIGLPLMYWSTSDDYPLNTFSVSYTGDGITSTEFITSSSLIPGQTVNVLLVKFSANTGTSSRTFNIHLSTSVSSDCTWDNTYTQNGATQTCGCNSITYNGTYEADPTPTASGFKVNVAVPNGKTSAYVSLYDANNTYLCGITRYPGGTTGTAYNWTAQGTVAKVAVTENGSSCKYLTINGKTGTTLLAKTQINTGSTVTNLDLTKTFNTSDYNDGNALLYFTFQDS
jgi:hypothetical protein